MIRLQIHSSLPQIHYIFFPKSIWWQIRGGGNIFILLPVMYWPTVTTFIIAYNTIHGPNEYLLMYNTSHITSSRLSNKPGYMILIGIPTQHYTLNYWPLEEQITAILTSPTYWSIYIWFPICSMSIAILYPILTYPFLLPPALKCLLIYQVLQVYSVNYFLTISIVYLSNLHNKNTPKAQKMGRECQVAA